MAVHVKRQVAVLEVNHLGTAFNDPARVYGMLEDGALRRTAAKPGAAETVPLHFPLPIDDLYTKLQAAPQTFSLLKYNGTNHFDFYHFDAATAAPAVAETAAADSVPAGAPVATPATATAPAMPPHFVDPASVGCTGRLEDADAVQDSSNVLASPHTLPTRRNSHDRFSQNSSSVPACDHWYVWNDCSAADWARKHGSMGESPACRKQGCASWEW